MRVPNAVKNNISDFFYDKTFTVYSKEASVDDEGFVSNEAEATTETFEGNVAFDNLEQIREDYGIKEEVNIKISTHKDIGLGTVVGYNNVLYKIVGKIPSDSHIILLGQKWS